MTGIGKEMTDYFRYIKTASKYLLQTWQNVVFFLLACAAIIFAVTITLDVLFRLLCAERIVRLVAMWLELGGSILVAIGLWNAWMPFGEGNPLSRLKQWWQNFPKFRPPPIKAEAIATLGFSMQATVRVGAGPNASVEERLAVLENARNSLDHQTTELFCSVVETTSRFSKDRR